MTRTRLTTTAKRNAVRRLSKNWMMLFWLGFSRTEEEARAKSKRIRELYDKYPPEVLRQELERRAQEEEKRQRKAIIEAPDDSENERRKKAKQELDEMIFRTGFFATEEEVRAKARLVREPIERRRAELLRQASEKETQEEEKRRGWLPLKALLSYLRKKFRA
jgi:alkanesulfonate monooxygenase SsuD/methylene tetrahydromethanopterin reductase-like flavin-dependent oxidoreductase (luciferase family)